MADSALDKLKKVFGFADEDEYEENYEGNNDENLLATEEENRNIKFKKRQIEGIHSGSGLIITIHEPLEFNESENIVKDLRADKAIVLNYEQLDMEVKKPIFHFVNGAVCALDAKIQPVNDDIYILAPKRIEIDGLQKELENSGMFPWKN